MNPIRPSAPRWSHFRGKASGVQRLSYEHLNIADPSTPVRRAAEAGLDQIAMVHDAFGTTPSRTGEFAAVLREEFAKMYQEQPFECLTRAATAAGVEAPDLPSTGSLDPAVIAHAEYLFA